MLRRSPQNRLNPKLPKPSPLVGLSAVSSDIGLPGAPPKSKKGEHVNKVFVGNLPKSATIEEIRSLFLRHGYCVRDVDLVKTKSGLLEGHAYVTLSPHTDPRRAIEDINGDQSLGRKLIVNAWPLHTRVSSAA